MPASSPLRVAEIAQGRPAPLRPAPLRPETLFLSLAASDVCNYRCRHCHIWMQSRRPDALPAERRLELVAEFARLNASGTVVFPGGEAMLDFEELLALLGACASHGLQTIVLTNGSKLQSAEAAAALVGSGATHVVVSLDGHTKAIHDYTRGVPGAFEETTNAIRLLAAERDRSAPRLTVMTAAVLFKENLAGFVDYVAFCRELGATLVDFQLLARTFANAHKSRDVFFEKHFWHSRAEKDEARARFTEIVERFAGDAGVVKKPADLPWILDYVEDPDFQTREPVCGSHDRNLLIDAEGNAALCFNTAAILDAPFVGNVRNASLEELWLGSKAAHDRDVMDRCTLNCGALNCHRRKESGPAELERRAWATVSGAEPGAGWPGAK